MTFQSFSFVLTDQVFKGAAVLLLAGLASLAIGRASAAKRNALWLSAFAALLLLPLTSLARPQWSWMPSPSMPKPVALLLLRPEPGALGSSPASRAAERSSGLPQWKSAVVGLWGAGVALLMARRLVVSRRLRRLLRASEPARHGPLSSAFSEMSKLLKRPARLRFSSECQAPITWGVWRPLVLLPKEAENWPEERLRIVFGHELGHIARWDAAARLLAQTVCAMHWFNPLVWMAARQLRLTQEEACDNLVLLQGTDPAKYATELVESVRRVQWERSSFGQALAMAQPSTLETRVKAIMDLRRSRDGMGWLPVWAGVAAVGLSLLASTLAQVAPALPSAPAGPSAKSNEPSAPILTAPAVETPSKPPTSKAPEPVPSASALPLFNKAEPSLQLLGKTGIFRPDKPIKITAERNVVEGGTMLATGSVTFEHNGAVIEADVIRYDTERRMVHAQGHVYYVEGKNTLETSDLELDLMTGLAKMTGPSKTRIGK